MTDPYRAMCAELVDAWDALPWEYDWLGNVIGIHCDRCDNSAVARARALLDQPVAEEPSDEELQEMWFGSEWFNEGATLREFISIARAALAKWGHQ